MTTSPNETAQPLPAIADLVPHKGAMCLLNEVVEIGEEHLRARITPRTDDPFADTSLSGTSGIPGWVGLEWLAQAIAAWSGHAASSQGGRPHIGFLLGARRYHCELDHFAFGIPVIVEIHLDYLADNGLGAFRGELQSADGKVLAHAMLNVFQPDSADALAAMIEETAS